MGVFNYFSRKENNVDASRISKADYAKVADHCICQQNEYPHVKRMMQNLERFYAERNLVPDKMKSPVQSFAEHTKTKN
ncbi:MAG: hypothetical protein FWD32_00790 [Firmicutes bacterium]|nr:hypothetical protein [Bacillota bacterium]